MAAKNIGSMAYHSGESYTNCGVCKERFRWDKVSDYIHMDSIDKYNRTGEMTGSVSPVQACEPCGKGLEKESWTFCEWEDVTR
tara:strand:+ start:2498 stop:2746 length:249 start_codon:yes stop_codon:yes gene_type:complete